MPEFRTKQGLTFKLKPSGGMSCQESSPSIMSVSTRTVFFVHFTYPLSNSNVSLSSSSSTSPLANRDWHNITIPASGAFVIDRMKTNEQKKKYATSQCNVQYSKDDQITRIRSSSNLHLQLLIRLLQQPLKPQ